MNSLPRSPKRAAGSAHGTRAGSLRENPQEIRWTAKEVDLMARYIQHDPPQPPEWGMADMKKSWKVIVAPKDRPKRKMNNYNIDSSRP